MSQITLTFYPKSLAKRTTVELVIPSLDLHGSLSNTDKNYYQNLKEKYPLCIFLSGFGDNLTSFKENSNIYYLLEKNNIAGCFISGNNSFYLNRGEIENYYSFLEDDLLDFLYGNFRFLSKDLPLALAGVSMGGFGAMYHYLKNVDKFTCAVALSPSLNADRIKLEKDDELESLFIKNKDKKLNLYLSIGDKDFIYEKSMKLNQFFKENKINLSYNVIKGKDHSWLTWLSEMESVITFLKKFGF